MPRKKAEDLSPAEWKIMRILWKLKACAIGDILAVAEEEHGWTRSTVKTLLRRMVDKGFVTTTRVGNSFLYRPARTPLKSLMRLVDMVVENTLEGTSGPLLAHMIKKCDLTYEETQELQELLAEQAAKKENKP